MHYKDNIQDANGHVQKFAMKCNVLNFQNAYIYYLQISRDLFLLSS